MIAQRISHITMVRSCDIEEYLTALQASRKFAPQVVCSKPLHGHSAVHGKPQQRICEKLAGGLKRLGIEQLYRHQAEAFDLISQGRDVLVATPTASGKSLIYNLPVLEEYLNERFSHFLYLFPLKALAQDQLRVLRELYAAVTGSDDTEDNFSAIYDGDTSAYRRTRIRKNLPAVLITNPDMLHLSLLPYHEVWSSFFKRLRYVVIDEVHSYRGVFGSHISWVIKRLIRVAASYGASPTFIMLSATVGNPKILGSRLTGRETTVIEQSGAPLNRKHILFINPWDSAVHTASQLLEAALKRKLRTIVYTKSRKMTELITIWTKPRLGTLGSKLSSYRAGFLPEERREIETALSSGELLGVISTSALELGIDIGDLDLCILVGYPGSIMATWQRAGRVGRSGRDSAVIMIGGEDALDQHFMKDPEDFFSRTPENAALNPYNSTIMRQHLHCAAAEIPLSVHEPLISLSTEIKGAIDQLAAEATLYLERSGEYWIPSRKRPQRLVDLRGAGVQLTIILQESGEVIGEIDGGRALKEAHPGAIYLHRTRTLLVTALDLDGREVVVTAFKGHYHTIPIVSKQTEILETITTKLCGGVRISFGKLKVTEQVSGYRKINNHTRKPISSEPLQLPEQIIETEGVWLDLQERHREIMVEVERHFMGAIHAIEHGVIAMFPLLILCDRNDIGGISCPLHEQTGVPSIFIYDGYSGGAGLSLEAFEVFEDLLKQVEKTIRGCHCDTGCPSCVHSPKCGSGNRPIDKAAALYLLQLILKADPRASYRFSSQIPPVIVQTQEGIGRKTTSGAAVNSLQPRGLDVLPVRYGVFDLETKFSAQEVGGWNRADRMGMSVGVVYDSQLDGYTTYLEDDTADMIEHLR
ncbi:MAG: DEAD/DEAH box helicase, partial [Desulfocapsaceae bacterium]|nr:DEAD/DEAH box helicase [Desulfocapsaceae bacterium]